MCRKEYSHLMKSIKNDNADLHALICNDVQNCQVKRIQEEESSEYTYLYLKINKQTKINK